MGEDNNEYNNGYNNNNNGLLDKAYYMKKDAENIRKRLENRDELSASRKNKKEEGEETSESKTNEKSKDKDEIGKKDSIEDGKKESSNDDKKASKENKREEKKEKRKENLKSKIEQNTFIDDVKRKWLKLKTTYKILCISISLACILFSFVTIFLIYDRIVNSISSFFGISEVDTNDNMSVEDADGLLTNEDYLINSETGEYFTLEELIDDLNKNNKCTRNTFFSNAADIFSRVLGIDDICTLLRYVNKREDKVEKNHPGLKLDRGLILSSIFYGYSFQPDYKEMNNSLESEEIIPSTHYFESLKDVLDKGIIEYTEIDDLIEYSYSTYTYYTWTVENNGIDDTSRIGKCSSKNAYGYDSTKWKIYMRFGKDAADEYDKLNDKQKAYAASSKECTGAFSTDELQEMVKNTGSNITAKLDPSVNTAINYFSNNDTISMEIFNQEANNESNIKDSFVSFQSGGKTIEFDYRNGFVYENFPYFKKSIEDPNINIEYDEIVTPKVCEDAIDYILEKKPDMNEILGLQDMDENNETYLLGADTETSVVLGAYCGNYLTAPIDSIKVNVTDCDGNFFAQVPMKDYIIGVAYREVSDRGANYVKTEMVAALSYALKRRNNYTKGNIISMKSGNCDQAFCQMDVGCHSKTAQLSCGNFKCTSYVPGRGNGTNTPIASKALISKYSAYYEEIKDFLIVKDDKIYSVSYNSNLANKWKDKSSSGMSYTQIIQESYPDATLIRCSETNDGTTTNNENDSLAINEQYGNEVDSVYTEISPNLGENYGFSYSRDKESSDININPEWIEHNIVTINSNCSEASWNEDYEVNIHSKDNFEKAFANVCKILKSGVKIGNGTTCKYNISDLTIGKTFIPKESLSGIVSDMAYGIAQDYNYNKSYLINGVSYSPYNSQATLEDYLDFVSALGDEEDCRNVNYILYKYAYKDAGFIWGGNNGRNGNNGKYNAMHYRIDY